LIVYGLFKASFTGLFIDLGAAYFRAAPHHIDSRFFSAHQRANNFIYNAVIDQWLNTFWSLHSAVKLSSLFLIKIIAYKKAADKYQRLNAPLVHPANT
jgi:hypothetical protein